jgi:hypothetical protein
MSFETSAARLWKRLPREERRLAALAFFREPPAELFGSAVAAIIRVRKLRPQVARSLSPEEQASALSTVLDPGEPLCAGLLIALHLGERRPLLVAFLDALGLPHENGLLKDADAAEPPGEEALQEAARCVAASFPREQVQTYFNVLWMQDPDHWGPLAKLEI